jgi:carbon storage regulator
MLVLSRKPGERVVTGDNVTITVVAVKGSVVRLAVQAPDVDGCDETRTLENIDVPTLVVTGDQEQSCISRCQTFMYERILAIA